MLGLRGGLWIGLFFALPFFLPVSEAQAEVEVAWYAGKPDSQTIDVYSELYAEYFEDIKAKLDREVTSSQMARARVVNVINKAVTHWKKHHCDHYEVSLTYLFVDGDNPLHYDFFITGDRIRKLFEEIREKKKDQ